MKRVFNMSLFKKIFLIILIVMLVIMFMFLGITWEIQKESIINNCLESIYNLDVYNEHPQGNGYKIDKIQDFIGLSWENDRISYNDALKRINGLDLNDFLVEDPVFIGDTAIISKTEDGIEIIKSSFDLKEYIKLDGRQYDISFLSEEQKASLLQFLKENVPNNNEKHSTDMLSEKVNYCIKDNRLVYLQWTYDEYAQATDNIKQANPQSFYLLDYFYRKENTGTDYLVVSRDELEEVIYNQKNIYTDLSSSGYEVVTIDNRTYVMYMTYLGGDYEENSCLNILDIRLITNLNREALIICLENYKWVYMLSFLLVILSSWCLSTIIAYPIGQLQLYALKISNNEFDEEVKVKSRDEIGSLANSIDIMRINLKHTIEQLNKEIEQVKKLESLRKDFINQFTHEMKTPLGIINGYSELIEETEDEQEREKYLNIINRETVRINELIQSMLKLSRLEAGKVELDIQQIDLEDIITEIVDEYDVLLMKKHIKVEIEVKNKNIMADEKQIRTVIRNFLSNAIKHTDNRIIITIDNGVSIYNEGSQIEEERLESIWYTFVTGDKSGTGLGLAICRSILELHGYRYGVINKSDGVEFYFYN